MTPALRDLGNEGVAEIPSQFPTTPTKLRAVEPLKEGPSLADRAHKELEELLERTRLHYSQNQGSNLAYREAFPPACKDLLHTLPGNRNCIDCNVRDPEWAAISYGALVCIKCSGIHRSLGVAVSQVRSVSMDHWTHKEIVSMLEGGNAQLGGFFSLNALTKEELAKANKKSSTPRQTTITVDNVTSLRYKTKAALFYKNQMEAHVERLLQKPYRGRSRPQT